MTDTMPAVAACVASSLCYAQGAIAQRRIAMAGREGRAGLVSLTLPVAASRALTGTEMVTVSVVSAAALATLTAGALGLAAVAAAGLVRGVVLLARGEQARTGSAPEVPLTPPIGSRGPDQLSTSGPAQLGTRRRPSVRLAGHLTPNRK